VINTYTSTGSKLIYHPVVVNKLRWEGKATPISLQVGPTSRCNLNCVFCSNANRETHEDLEIGQLKRVIKELRFIGLKTVEWTGGEILHCMSILISCFRSVMRLGLNKVLFRMVFY
jgi:MoaA/NifB/PqqE/SkfB family radical SAM enzyme